MSKPVIFTITATWDDVGYYDENLDKLNAFQLQLIAVGGDGDFDIVFRYEAINWTTGDASGGDGGLFGQVAVAGYSSGDGENYVQLSQSGNQAGMLALQTASNVSVPGLFTFSIRHGVPVVAQISIAATSAEAAEIVPLTVPWSTRQISRCTGDWANPIAPMKTPHPTSERTSIGLRPRRSARLPQIGAMIPSDTAWMLFRPAAQSVASRRSGTPSSCTKSGRNGVTKLEPREVSS